MKKHKSLTSQTLTTERIKLKFSKELSQDFLSETKLNSKISFTSNIENSVDDWTVLRTTAERCLQFLSKLDSNELHKIGELVKPKEFLTMMTRICSYFY
ncbi:7617_t:CDS:2 [Rhizophagus irregularis]|nr:7617_t:CDS:2 [Rhizophagus irregularis]